MVGAARLLGRTLVLPPLVDGRWSASHAADRPRAEARPAGTRSGPPMRAAR